MMRPDGSEDHVSLEGQIARGRVIEDGCARINVIGKKFVDDLVDAGMNPNLANCALVEVILTAALARITTSVVPNMLKGRENLDVVVMMAEGLVSSKVSQCAERVLRQLGEE